MRRIKFSNCRIVRSKKHQDGTYELVVELKEKTAQDKINEQPYMLVEASKLSLDDEFMHYQPITPKEIHFKKMLTVAIKRKIKDFYRPRCDPSFNATGNNICYVAGRLPAIGKTYNWWDRTARAFDRKHHSRLGTKSEYIAFCGVLIKKLIEKGWAVEDAWHAVCCDSRELGHYSNSKNALHDFELTGAREVCGFFDLANTHKIFAEDNTLGGFYLGGGFFTGYSNKIPLANYFYLHDRSVGNDYKVLNSVGWVILTTNPYED